MDHNSPAVHDVPASLLPAVPLLTLTVGWTLASRLLHKCPADVIVSVTVPGVGQFESRWCIGCLEDSDSLDALSRLVPDSSVSVRAAA